jgi:hypothetical protein
LTLPLEERNRRRVQYLLVIRDRRGDKAEVQMSRRHKLGEQRQRGISAQHSRAHKPGVEERGACVGSGWDGTDGMNCWAAGVQ